MNTEPQRQGEPPGGLVKVEWRCFWCRRCSVLSWRKSRMSWAGYCKLESESTERQMYKERDYAVQWRRVHYPLVTTKCQHTPVFYSLPFLTWLGLFMAKANQSDEGFFNLYKLIVFSLNSDISILNCPVFLLTLDLFIFFVYILLTTPLSPSLLYAYAYNNSSAT